MDVSEQLGEDSDPRITGEYVRPLSDGVTLVGVVHDHPASIYRVREVVGAQNPAVLALELPPVAVSLFEEYAADERTPPAFGGEMSAAIQAAEAQTVGIDRPTGRYFRTLLRRFRRTRPSLDTVRKLLSNTYDVSKHAVICAIAGVVAMRSSIRLEVDFPVAHDTAWRDQPEEQALDERKQIRRSRSFMNVFGSKSTTRASQFEDATREETMAARLSELRREGDVVAVVGIDHFDPITERLEGSSSQGSPEEGT